MNALPPSNIKEILIFLKLKKYQNSTRYKLKSKSDRYSWIRKTTWNLKYRKLTRADKTLVIKYLSMITGYREAQTKRLIKKAINGKLKDPKTTKNKTSFHRLYNNRDIAVLAELDRLLNYPSGQSLAESCKLQYVSYHDEKFVRLQNISKSQIYNLRELQSYKSVSLRLDHTRPAQNNSIGKRQKPVVTGSGFIRVDSVHYGYSEDGEKGCYFINLIDELTQMELLVYVEGISQRFMAPAIEMILLTFPFVIHGFHSDNGSEFINEVIADILNRHFINQTKSRSGKHNDNALVECKNCFIVRKHFGYSFISAVHAEDINIFLKDHFNSFLNYYRICEFPTVTIDENGKRTRTYKQRMTPFQKLKAIDPEGKCLREGLTYELLEQKYATLDLVNYMRQLSRAKELLFKKIRS